MANSDIYVKNTKISEISAGKIDFQIRVRVINLWSTPDRANPAIEGAIHMVFLDESRERIHATIRRDLISQFKDAIEEGSAYVLEKFMVAKNDTVFRSTPHKHKLNFMRGTKVQKVKAPEIPMNHFQFMSFQDILSNTKEDCLLDVIGHVVEKNAMKETEKNGKVNKVMDVTLEDLEGNRVHCTLWDEFALKMQDFLATHDPTLPVIMIFQLCKLKKYFGVMGISNSFHGSKLYLNADLLDVAEYMDRMNVSNIELTQVVSQMTEPVVVSLADELLQTQRMTIEDLIESTERCFGSVLAWTCEFDTDAGWFYQACTKCASRISYTGGQLYCDKCKLPRTAVPRYKIHLQVIDNTGSITFILFDRIVAQLVGRTAQDLLDSIVEDNSSNPFPPELDMLIDKRVLFKVEVTDANLYRNWRGYTVKKMTDDGDIIGRFTELHGIHLGGNGEDHLDGAGADVVYDADLCHLDNIDPLEAVEGVDSNNNEGIVNTNGMHTPTSKVAGAKALDFDGAGGSAAKKIVIFDDAGANPIDVPPSRTIGKRSADLGEVDATASKETKMVCVKNGSAK